VFDGEKSGHGTGKMGDRSISDDGNTVAVGSLSAEFSISDDGNTIAQGHVRVFDWNGSAWTQRGSNIDGEAADDRSGTTSISSDGDTVAIGASKNDGNGTDSGHVRVFDWDGNTWTQRGSDIDGEAADDLFGYYVSMSNDGNTVAVGAWNNDGNGTDSGHARVFDWNNSAWVQRGSDIDGEAAGDNFSLVSMSNDGNTVAIGAWYNDGNGTDSGHVRVFDWDGNTWTQRGSDIDGEAADDLFGYYVSMSNDGNTVAVGAWNNDGNGTDSGHARVFDWNNSAWVQRGSDIDGEAAGDNFSLVSMSNDGNTVAIGAWYNDGNGTDSGHVRVFDWDANAWTQRGSDIDGEAAGDENSVASISNDGDTVAIGAYYNDGNGSNSGHVPRCVQALPFQSKMRTCPEFDPLPSL
jgi:Na+-transporting NADH:ubiquinone oxidoreductase subunit NqrC